MTQATGLDLDAHLSEEALDALLLEKGSASDAAHLAACAECAARVEDFRLSVAMFRQASFSWSEARSNGISRDLRSQQPRFSVLPAWSIAAAFLFAVALTFVVGVFHGRTRSGVAPVETAQRVAGMESDPRDEIANDNAMLHAIDSAISQPVASPVEVYSLQKTESRAHDQIPHEVRD